MSCNGGPFVFSALGFVEIIGDDTRRCCTSMLKSLGLASNQTRITDVSAATSGRLWQMQGFRPRTLVPGPGPNLIVNKNLTQRFRSGYVFKP
mmetsp:Transcript_17066/g.36070  ORF Transcript_17066/g.36070 Transcript_17066/m.36070 type:complete len:92 (+) Transcript_17066:831-1106(+)